MIWNSPKNKLVISVIVDTIILSAGIFIISFFGKQNTYYRYGPHDNLTIVGLEINTWLKYILLHLFILIDQISQVIINSFGSPVLGFNIYNPDKKVIKDFKRHELEILGNAMYLIGAIRSSIAIILVVSQLDIAIARACYSFLASAFVIHLLLDEKKYAPYQNPTNYDSLV